MPLFHFLSEPDAEQRCAADPDEGGERADHGENGTADADTRERQITDRGNVADVHTVYNAVQNTHELCQHARKSNTGTSFPIGSVPRWFTVFIEKYLVVF